MCQTLYSLWNGKKCDRCLFGIVIQDRSGPVIQRRPEAGVVKSVGVDLAEAGRQHQLFQTAASVEHIALQNLQPVVEMYLPQIFTSGEGPAPHLPHRVRQYHADQLRILLEGHVTDFPGSLRNDGGTLFIHHGIFGSQDR